MNSAFIQICPGNFKNCGPCPLGTAELSGTGFEINNTGGGTSWLTSASPVVPGETVALDFLLFDVADGILDTSVLLDDFRWTTAP
ncbi:MAG: hypothetical protein FJ033_16600 [Chloroflexi bacterium]|nr:hypothetical protein [Chloroflexota bacterium]